jgi:menaquinone-dependent protoporphyrinogen oxidase
LFAQTGWRPARIENVAGGLAYTRYNFLMRFVISELPVHRWINRHNTRSRYTDWAALDRFAAEFADEVDHRTEAKLFA